MKPLLYLICLLPVIINAATRHVDLMSSSPAFPYDSWANAANDIQTAVDAADTGDTVLVADGRYVLSSELTVLKDITIKSLNGPETTVIQSTGTGRCVNLGNQQTLLSGFTITGGRAGGSYSPAGNGGGVYCSGTNPVIDRCILSNNVAGVTGGAVYQGTVRKCLVTENRTGSLGSGGGLSFSIGINCTIVNNTAMNGAGVSQSTLYNSIIVSNELSRSLMGSPDGNIYYSSAYYCCSPALNSDENGNISTDPLLNSDWKLTADSPCAHAGQSLEHEGGADLDGEYWGSPPSIGFDELSNAPLFELSGPQHLLTSQPGTFEYWGITDAVIRLGDGRMISGQNPFPAAWDTPGTYLMTIEGTNVAAACSILFTQQIHVVAYEDAVIHVSAEHGNDEHDGSDWNQALATLQAGIDAQHFDYGQILVSNGWYQLSNEVRLQRPITIRSVNGWEHTVLNGNGTEPCLILEHPETGIHGFTIQNGAGVNGGGISCSDTNPVIERCLIQHNTASGKGGGVYKGTLLNSQIQHNTAGYGGGVHDSSVFNSAIAFNESLYGGGGARNAELTHCNVIGNTLVYDNDGPGVDDCLVRNSIVYYNRYSSTYRDTDYQSDLYNSCASDVRNPTYYQCITNAPRLKDLIHIRSDSPCKGGGSDAWNTGTDFDGENRTSPPSMGCDDPFGIDPPGNAYIPPVYVRLTTQADHGTVSTDPAGPEILSGTLAALTATPDPGYIFSGWSGDAAGFNNPLELQIYDDTQVTAHFAAAFDGAALDTDELEWTATKSSNGLGGYNEWTEQTADYVSGGSALATPSMSSFENIHIDTYITGPAVVKFHWKVGGNRPGRIVCSVDGSNQTSIQFGTDWTEDAVTVPAGRHRVRWQTETLTSIASMGPAYLDNIRIIYGNYAALSLAVSTKGELLAHPSTNVFSMGETVEVEAVPAPGYEFIDWEGSHAGQSNPLTLVMNRQERISALFYRMLDGNAVGHPGTKWYTDGVGEWKINDPDGGFVNGAVNGRGGTWIETSFLGPCEMSFDWKFEPNREGADGLYLYQDGAQTKAPDQFDWTRQTLQFDGGAHTVRVSFANFVDVNALNNKNAYMRNITFTGPAWLAGAQPLDDNSFHSPFFGTFRFAESNLVLSAERGWQYLHPENDALFYDYALSEWLWIERKYLPFARRAEAPSQWFLHDHINSGFSSFDAPPAAPEMTVTPIAAVPFPSNTFLTVSSSPGPVFSMWRNPEFEYDFQNSSTLTNWHDCNTNVLTNGASFLIYPASGTEEYFRALISEK